MITSLIFLTGKIDIQLNVDIPEYVDLIEPLGESCIWRQTRGAATEISEADSTITSSEKVSDPFRPHDLYSPINSTSFIPS